MPSFEALDPKDVTLGRGRRNALDRVAYVEAIRSADAGRIELDEGDTPDRVKRLIRQASKQTGIRVRPSWETPERWALLWKRVGA